MALFSFIHIAQPTLIERWLVIAVQWVFYLALHPEGSLGRHPGDRRRGEAQSIRRT
jgi:hypothetical protein